jgi:hypothetical protein
LETGLRKRGEEVWVEGEGEGARERRVVAGVEQ